MKISVKKIIHWLLLGPLIALIVSLLCHAVLVSISPDKITSLNEMLSAFPLGLLLSLLTPWGWLMYGGLLLMHSDNPRRGTWCTLAGSLLFGLFWPIWATFLVAP